jgi:excinuclease UvrABC nuclease subunit
MVDRFVPNRPGVYMIELDSIVIDVGRANDLRDHLRRLLGAGEDSELAQTLEFGGLRIRIRYQEAPPESLLRRERFLRRQFKPQRHLRAA